MVAVYQSFAAASSAGASPVVNKPAGTVSGDGLVAWVLNFSPGSPVTPPAGWSLRAGASTTDAIYEKTAGGSEPATYTWATALFQGAHVLIFRVTGQSAAPFVEAATITAYAVVNTSVVLASLSPSAGNRLLFSGILSGSNNTWTPPGTTTERFDSLDPNNFARAGGDEVVGSGATGTRTWTPNSQAFAGGFMVAIKPGVQNYTQALTAVMDGTPTLARDVTAFRLLSAVMDGTPTMARAFVSRRTLTAVMDGTATMTQKIAKTLTAVMDGTASLVRKTAKTLTAVMDGTPSLSRKTSTTLTVVMDGTPTLVRAVTVNRTLSAVMNGIASLSPASVISRILSAVMNGIPRGEVKFPWDSIPDGSCPADWTPNDGLKSIEGDVFFHEPPNEGDPVVGAEVTLIRDSDGLRIATVFTDAAGHYTFPRDTNDPYTYHVEVRDGSQQGLSEEGCVPS